MKTSVNMVRSIDNYKILQRTKDGYFDANSLLQQWNKENSKKEINKFLNLNRTQEFISTIHDMESPVDKSRIGEYQSVSIKKGRNTKRGKTPDEVWMHPYLFIDFAMWLNPAFKYHVIKFVHDQLISNRIEAGGGYKDLSKIGSKLKGYNYKEVARAMNFIVFGKQHSGQRQVATQEQLKEINEIQNKLSYAVEMDLVSCFSDFMELLRNMYKKKYSTPF